MCFGCKMLIKQPQNSVRRNQLDIEKIANAATPISRDIISHPYGLLAAVFTVLAISTLFRNYPIDNVLMGSTFAFLACIMVVNGRNIAKLKAIIDFKKEDATEAEEGLHEIEIRTYEIVTRNFEIYAVIAAVIFILRLGQIFIWE